MFCLSHLFGVFEFRAFLEQMSPSAVCSDILHTPEAERAPTTHTANIFFIYLVFYMKSPKVNTMKCVPLLRYSLLYYIL